MSQSRTPRSTKNTMKNIEKLFEEYLTEQVNMGNYSRSSVQKYSKSFNPGAIRFANNTPLRVKAETYKRHMEKSAQQQKACYRLLENEQRMILRLMRLFEKLKREVDQGSINGSRRSSSRSRK